MNDTTAPPPAPYILELISYNKTAYDKLADSSCGTLLTHLKDDRVNWINLDGLNNQDVVETLQNHFQLDHLLIDDVLGDQRPKVELFDKYTFVTLKMLYQLGDQRIDYEQISLVLGKNFLISFQEKSGDMFDGFRDRIRLDKGRVRKKGADYLMYRLLDIIVSNYYNILDKVAEFIEETSEIVYEEASKESFQRIQSIKKELLYLRKSLFPLRDALNTLTKGESPFIRDENIRYFSDVYEQVVHLIDHLDTYRELTSSLVDVHINAMNIRMNEVMKVLTMIATIFIPLTFIVGVYGMNFDVMPELRWRHGYMFVWIVMIVIALGMLRYFRYKKWL